MEAVIEVTSVEIGNPRRGYHDTHTTIGFRYKAGSGQWSSEREQEIVAYLTNKTGNMWWNIMSHVTTGDIHTGAWSVYVVKHGYDSGD